MALISSHKKFALRFEPHDPRDSPVGWGGFSAYVGQRIRQDDAERMWDSVIIHGDEEADGTLAIRVLIVNPDWAGSLQIACLRARPASARRLSVLECDLDHISISRDSP